MQRRACLGWMAGAAALSPAMPWPAAVASALRLPTPAEARALGPDARLQGQMRFRYWGFHVYDAQLWVKPGFDPLRFGQHPLVLSLTYARALKASDIVQRSLEEIERQREVAPDEATRWQKALERVLVDVQAGDRLGAHYAPPDQGRFYVNGQPHGVLIDPALMPLFMGIWLAPQTSEPRLRRALLGLDAPRDGGLYGT
jgi:hypothetical protein